MATYEITDSILKRHAEQMATAGTIASSVADSAAGAASTATAAATNSATQAADAVGNTVNNAASEASDAVASAANPSSPWKGLIYAVVAIVVVWLAMKFFGGS